MISGTDSLAECVDRVEALLKFTTPGDRQAVAVAVAQWCSNYATQAGAQASATRQSSAAMPAFEGGVTVGPRNKR